MRKGESAMNTQPILAWHFAHNDMRLAHGDGRKIVAGETLTVRGDIELCNRGLHASRSIIDALYYAPKAHTQICRVEVGGDVTHGDNKLCGTSRTCLWVVAGGRVLHEFACRCAEDALACCKLPDPRSIAAIKAKRDWLAGKITDDDLNAARAAARAAAYDAAMAAAYDAAYDAASDAAYDAAYAAAYDAAMAAAMAAAYAAAYNAAWAAAKAAARAAAYDAARAAQNRRLSAMVTAAHRRGAA